MVLNIVSTHGANLALSIIPNFFLRCWDRGLSCDKKKTKAKTKDEYIATYTDNEFELGTRYSGLMMVVGVTFLFSAGMPILYPVAAAFCFVGFFVDKTILLYFSQKPDGLDAHIAKGMQSHLSWILLGHFAVGFFMFANRTILTSGGRVLTSNEQTCISD